MSDEILSMPAYKERVFFLGANGSGKSVLAAHMLAAGDYDFVAFDSKGDFNPPTEFATIRKPTDPRWKIGYRKIVYRPDMEFNSGKWLDEMLRRMYVRAQKSGRTRPFVVYIDEALYLAEVGKTQWLSALAVSGRSLGVGLWCSSQRPRWIPVSVRSEAWRTYLFFLSYEEDEKEALRTAKGQLTLDDLHESTADHAFIELRRGQGGQVLVKRYPPLRINEGESK